MATIMWSMGASMLVAGVVHAADDKCTTLNAGDVVKSDKGPALYTVTTDGELLPWEQGNQQHLLFRVEI